MREQAAVKEAIAKGGTERRPTPGRCWGRGFRLGKPKHFEDFPCFLDKNQLKRRCREGRGDRRIEISAALHFRAGTRIGTRFGLAGASRLLGRIPRIPSRQRAMIDRHHPGQDQDWNDEQPNKVLGARFQTDCTLRHLSRRINRRLAAGRGLANI